MKITRPPRSRILATSAAIFYLWQNQIVLDDVKPYAQKGKEALEPFLTAQEKSAVADGTYDDAGYGWGSRLRYLEWYDWLVQNSN